MINTLLLFVGRRQAFVSSTSSTYGKQYIFIRLATDSCASSPHYTFRKHSPA